MSWNTVDRLNHIDYMTESVGSNTAVALAMLSLVQDPDMGAAVVYLGNGLGSHKRFATAWFSLGTEAVVIGNHELPDLGRVMQERVAEKDYNSGRDASQVAAFKGYQCAYGLIENSLDQVTRYLLVAEHISREAGPAVCPNGFVDDLERVLELPRFVLTNDIMMYLGGEELLQPGDVSDKELYELMKGRFVVGETDLEFGVEVADCLIRLSKDDQLEGSIHQTSIKVEMQRWSEAQLALYLFGTEGACDKLQEFGGLSAKEARAVLNGTTSLIKPGEDYLLEKGVADKARKANGGILMQHIHPDMVVSIDGIAQDSKDFPVKFVMLVGALLGHSDSRTAVFEAACGETSYQLDSELTKSTVELAQEFGLGPLDIQYNRVV